MIASVTTDSPATKALTAPLTTTLALAAASWLVAVLLMAGMDMGPATRLGSFWSFVAMWVVMMAAMMLPGTAPAVARRADTAGARAAARFTAGYLAVWVVAGAAVFALDRPHGTGVAGVMAAAGGVYELTPLKRRCRGQCVVSGRTGSGVAVGLCCTGSSVGLMAILLAVGVMNVGWMAVITVVVLAQKVLPAKPTVDVPLTLAIVGFAILMLWR